MHIPDGILSPTVWISTAALSGIVLSRSVRYANQKLAHRTVPVMGAMAAFLFAAQMINFPLLGAAASGHLIGGALSAILFGFWPTTLIMTIVVFIQAFVFQDGGITALGVNIFNMAILAPAAALSIHKLFRAWKVPASLSVFSAAWCSVVAVSLAGALQLALSGVIPFTTAAPALLIWHALIGVGEGLITVAVLPYALRSSFMLESREVLS